MESRRGFTLIELLVVIAIIALLSSVVMAALDSARVKARDARRLSDLKQISTALALYYDQYGSYPVGGEGSDRADWKNNTGQTANHPLGALKDAGVMSVVPYDPGKNTYVGSGCGGAQFYSYWSNGQQFLIGAVNESEGSSGCTVCGNWQGPSYGASSCSVSSYGYQNVTLSN